MVMYVSCDYKDYNIFNGSDDVCECVELWELVIFFKIFI